MIAPRTMAARLPAARLMPLSSQPALLAGGRPTLTLSAPFSAPQRREYRVQTRIPWARVRSRALQSEGKQRTTKNRNHAEVLKRFRLTRFGWERRRARFH